MKSEMVSVPREDLMRLSDELCHVEVTNPDVNVPKLKRIAEQLNALSGNPTRALPGSAARGD